MGRFVAGNAPSADAALADALAAIGKEIDALRVPSLAGVVLGGGYGRGEGGLFVGADGSERLSNDLDFFAISKEGATDASASAIAVALEQLARRWTEKLGIDVDFTARTPWRIRHDQERLMVQELIHGYVDVAGEKGEALFSAVEKSEPDALPWMEAARLLMNRGVGLLLALERGLRTGERGMDDFCARNLNKCILGAGDARLIARQSYTWRATDRAATLGDPLYARAVAWKFRPCAEPVCDWETARAAWQAAWNDVRAAAGRGFRRTLRHAARWLVRRRTVGARATFGQDPVLRVLARVAQSIETRTPLTAELRRDWEIFN